MEQLETDFFGRLRGALELFGPVGFFAVILLALAVSIAVIWRGTGPALFLLFLSYSFSAMTEGGVVFLSTLVRWAGFILCLFGFFRLSSGFKKSTFFFLFYTLSGLFFVLFSQVLFWSMQRAVLLLLLAVSVPAAVNSYISNPDKIGTLFKMGIISATVWVGVSMLFLKEFLQSTNLQFGGETVVGAAWAGAFYAPMILWGIVQQKQMFWRVFCMVLAFPFVFLLFIGGVRTAIFGMLIIASLPTLFAKIRPVKVIGSLAGLGILAVSVKYVLYTLVSDRAVLLTERVFSADTTGRVDLWLEALRRCMETGFVFGKGIGSNDIMDAEIGLGFHNAYLVIWYNAGFVALLAILLFLFIYIARSYRLSRSLRNHELGDYARIGLGYMLGIAAIGMFENSFSTSSGIAVFMLMVVTTLIDRISRMQEQFFGDTLSWEEEYLANSPYGPQAGDEGLVYA